MLNSANDSVRRLKAALAAAEAATATARGEAGAAARVAEEADTQLAEREAEIAALQCAASHDTEALKSIECVGTRVFPHQATGLLGLLYHLLPSAPAAVPLCWMKRGGARARLSQDVPGTT